MESRLRHDLRHPISTISMIASTMAEFGGSVGEDVAEMYGSRVLLELTQLEALIKEHELPLQLSEFRRVVERFSAAPKSAQIAIQLDGECSRLLDQIAVAGS